MKTQRTMIAAAAVAVLAAGAPAAAVQDGDIAMLSAATPPDRAERAARLWADAEALFSQPRQWKKAVRLLEQSAALRDAADAGAYECLQYAGRISAAIGDMSGARENFEKAAAHALARGAVTDAANAYIDAAHAAAALKDGPGARELLEKAALLSDAPALSSTERNLLKSRINA